MPWGRREVGSTQVVSITIVSKQPVGNPRRQVLPYASRTIPSLGPLPADLLAVGSDGT